MKYKLKPCPFCGGSELTILEIRSGCHIYFRVVCHEKSKVHAFNQRHVEGPLMETKESAIAAWNNQAVK